jgi:hypothetical protein
MGDDRRWMYDGWNKSQAPSAEWIAKTNDFIEREFSLSPINKIRCPCTKCQNYKLVDKMTVATHLYKFGFVPYYETWVFHGEKYTTVEAEEGENASAGINRMDEMLEAIQPEFDLNTEDQATPEVEEFFSLLKASEEPLHEHTKVTLLAFVTRLMAIKSKFFFSNNCYNELIKLFGDVLPEPHKLPIDMYYSKKLLKGLGMRYQKIDVCPDNCMLFWKEHKKENKCLKCGKMRYVEVVNDDGEMVTTEVAHKQLRYMPITPRLK